MACKLYEDKESSAGFSYSSSNPPVQTHMLTQMQDYEPNNTLEMIGFSKNLQQPTDDGNAAVWKGFFGKQHPSQPGPSYSKMTNESTSDYYFTNKLDFTTQLPAAEWQQSRMVVDDSFRNISVFSCERNERPSQGLSLSLSSTNPSTIGLQAFELRQSTQHHNQDELRFGSSTSSVSRDGFVGKSSSFCHQGQFQLKTSKYLDPAQELLNEFCSLGMKQTDQPTKKSTKFKALGEENGSSSSSCMRKESLHSLDFTELQKRKAKLLLMLEEVDKRYKQYRDQLKAVMESFEVVAGGGAANVYSTLASKAMSRHFRCLRDAIMDQIQATKNAMGEKGHGVPGMSKGETPRLKILDQAFRQRRALQQMTMMENHPWRPQRGLPERSVSVLRAWLFEHFLHPYPTDVDKHILARQTGLSRSQVSNWFINARVRLWKPMVEDMYLEELKEQGNTTSSDRIPEENPHQASTSDDQNPTRQQPVRIDSECLSSIITNQDKNEDRNSKKPIQNLTNLRQNPSFGRVGEAFGTVDLDFSSYDNGSVVNHNFGGGGGGGVSLTLGLQQHGGSGVTLAFSSSQNSLFYSREHIEDSQQAQYSLIDGEGQNLPYRHLMGAQLLHDFDG